MGTTQLTTIGSLILSILLAGLAGYLTVKGIALSDWLTLLLGGGFGGLVGTTAHNAGVNAGVAAVNGTNGSKSVTSTSTPTSTIP